jgi:hypothetical protein
LRHRQVIPNHSRFILTAKDYCSLDLIVKHAHERDKVYEINGKLVIENPYKSDERRGRPSMNKPKFSFKKNSNKNKNDNELSFTEDFIGTGDTGQKI